MKTNSIFKGRFLFLAGIESPSEAPRNFPKEANKLRYDIRKLQEKEPTDEGSKKLREQLRQVANGDIKDPSEASEIISDAKKYLENEREKYEVKKTQESERQSLYGMELTEPRKASGEAGGFDVQFDVKKRSPTEIAEMINMPKVKERFTKIGLGIGLKFESARSVVYAVTGVDSENALIEKSGKNEKVKKLRGVYDNFYDFTIQAADSMRDKIYDMVADPDFENKANKVMDETVASVKKEVLNLKNAIDVYIAEAGVDREKGREIAESAKGADWDEFLKGFDGKPIEESAPKYVENTIKLDEPAGVHKLELQEEQALAEKQRAVKERIDGLNAKIPEKFTSWVWFEAPKAEPDVALLAYKSDPLRVFHLNRYNLENLEISVNPEDKNKMDVQIDPDTKYTFDISEAKKTDVKVSRWNAVTGGDDDQRGSYFEEPGQEQVARLEE